jgi:hypothetical protein
MLPSGTALTAAVEVADGTLTFAGSAVLGALGGAGAVRIEGGNVITVPAAGGVVIEAVLQQAGDDVRVNGSCVQRLFPGRWAGCGSMFPAAARHSAGRCSRRWMPGWRRRCGPRRRRCMCRTRWGNIFCGGCGGGWPGTRRW